MPYSSSKITTKTNRFLTECRIRFAEKGCLLVDGGANLRIRLTYLRMAFSNLRIRLAYLRMAFSNLRMSCAYSRIRGHISRISNLISRWTLSTVSPPFICRIAFSNCRIPLANCRKNPANCRTTRSHPTKKLPHTPHTSLFPPSHTKKMKQRHAPLLHQPNLYNQPIFIPGWVTSHKIISLSADIYAHFSKAINHFSSCLIIWEN